MAKETGKKMGRPLTKIDKKTFEGLCELQCTVQEVAGFFDCHEDTVQAWCKRTYGTTFSGIFKQKSAGGKISLRRTQFRLAEKSPAMAIFLGKQLLGQRDMVDVSSEEISKVDNILDSIRNMAEDAKEKRKENADR